jgi:hypothetical protein
MNSRWGLLAGSLLWVAFVFGLQVAVSAAIGRDSGLGDEFYCMVRLHERDDLLLLDRVVGCEGTNTRNEFVLLHTLYFDVKRFSTQEEMLKGVRAVGILPELRLVSDVYRERRGWALDAALLLLAVLPPVWFVFQRPRKARAA